MQTNRLIAEPPGHNMTMKCISRLSLFFDGSSKKARQRVMTDARGSEKASDNGGFVLFGGAF